MCCPKPAPARARRRLGQPLGLVEIDTLQHSPSCPGVLQQVLAASPTQGPIEQHISSSLFCPLALLLLAPLLLLVGAAAPARLTPCLPGIFKLLTPLLTA